MIEASTELVSGFIEASVVHANEALEEIYEAKEGISWGGGDNREQLARKYSSCS